MAVAALAGVIFSTLAFLRAEQTSAQKRVDSPEKLVEIEQEAVMAGNISGRVFQDYNQNGTMDTTQTIANNGFGTIGIAIDRGIPGVEVRAYNGAGANVTTGSVVTTDASGNYTIVTTDVGSGPYRVEFTNLPTDYQPSARSTDSVNGGTATNSGSTVQFVSAPVTNVNLAINYPTDYSQSNPEIVASMYAAGDQLAAPNSGLPVVVSFPYSAGSSDATAGATESLFETPAANPLSLFANEVGTTYGLAYARRTRLVYAAAFFKRHAGFGPGGPNRVYVIDRSTGGFVSSAFTVPGTVTNAHDTTAPIDWQRDNDNTGWDGVGKTSLGGMALSDDEATLYVMNLANRTLYALNPTTGAQIAAQAAPTNLPLPSGTCNANDARPFAVTFYHGALYVGMVCSAESTLAAGTVDTFTDSNANGRYDGGEYHIETNGTAGRQVGESFLDFNGNTVYDAGEAFVDNDGNGFYNQGDARSLRAYVYSVNPTTLAFGASPIFQLPLNYRRGVNTHTNGAFGIWRPWSSTYRDAGTATTSRPIYSQPMLTDIAFDKDNLIIALRDRVGDQIGNGTLSNPGDPSTTNFYQPRTAGDAIRACGAIGAWTVESNGRCGGTGTAPQNVSEGPGGGEFYYGDSYDLADDYVSPAATINGKGGNHDDTLSGGVEQMPGAPDVVVSNFDPIPNIPGATHDGGIRWLSNTTGAFTKAYRMYNGVGNDTGILGKAGGIGGSLVMLYDPAPIEIGNRVWRDANNNGVQDPGELGIAGITVRLYQGSTLLGTAVTDANGEYYFVSSTVVDPNTGDNVGQVNGGILYSTTYQVRFDNPTNYASGQPLNGLVLTTINQTSQNGDDDGSDSDASTVVNPSGSPVGIFPVIALTTGGPGANNHTFDVGFAAIPSAADVSVSGRVMLQAGNGIRGVRVTLTEEDGTVHHTLTGAFGYYRFEGTPSGQSVIISLKAKRFTFTPSERLVALMDEVADLDFVADQ
jgi:SdrD B-like domain/Carboxypeptidase regulatory-like domain